MGIESWSTTPANNNASPPNGAPEGQTPSSVNNVMRQQMADHRTQWENARWFNFGYTHTYASSTSVTIATDLTATYEAGRRIKASGSVTGTIYGVISSSSYGAPNTTVNITWDSGSLSNEALTVWLSIETATNNSHPAKIHVPTAYTGQQTFTRATLTDAANIDWNLNTQQIAKVVLAGNRTMNAPTNLKDGGQYELMVIQDSTGSRTINWNATYKWPNSNQPTLSTAAGAVDILTFTCDGTYLYGSYNQGY